LLAIAWVIAAPGFLTLPNFALLTGLFAAFGWVLKSTYLNARPAISLAQTIHDLEAAAIEPGGKAR
jgi:hypothetical protein